MIVFLVVVLVCIALWYVVFVVFGAFWRPDRKSTARPTVPIQAPTASASGAVQTPSLGWTALDDQQLTRLLKGSAP